MLQQTQASRVTPIYAAFLQRFPTIRDLAAASRGAVIQAWAGLGYNRRAVALFEAARKIVQEHDGRVPSQPETLQGLPGIGPYTATAVASIAFGASVAAIDTNVRRVIARVATGQEAGGLSKDDARAIAAEWLDPSDPAAWNQALMDLGREVCRPRPRCDRCPLAPHCRYRRREDGAAARTRVRSRPGSSAPFEGSSRQLRGQIVSALRDRSPLTLQGLARVLGRSLRDVAAAVDSLARDGLVRAGSAAIRARPMGRVELAP